VASDDAVSRGVDALSMLVVGEATLGETLLQVAELSVELLAPVAFCGLTLLIDGKAQTGVFTDPAAPHIDQAQYDSGHGPCLEAFSTGDVIRVPSTADDRRWPEFSAAAFAHGIRSTLSMPLRAGQRPLGAMNLYSHEINGFTADDQIAAGRFAAQASIVLANAQLYAQSVTLNTQLHEAMRTREIISQAQGIIMGAMRCDADTAFNELVRQSQHQNRKLHVVAQGIVADISRARH